MGNNSSSSSRRNSHHHPPPPDNRYVYPSATPYPIPPPPPQQQPQPFYQYGPPPPPPGYYGPMPLPPPYDPHHHNRIGGPPHHGFLPPPYPMHAQAGPNYAVEHQKAITIKNDVNLKKETLRLVPDPNDPSKFLVSFNYDANTPGHITVFFFAKEGSGSNQIPTKENLFKPVAISFKEGLGQKFCQPSGTGIDFSMFDESELTIKEGEMEVYPLVVIAQGLPPANNNDDESNDGKEEEDDKTTVGNTNSQVTQAVFVKDENGGYHPQVVKQILWVKGTRYELQEIYGIANSVDNDFDGNDPGKECVICLSEPRDTTALPCRHMCMCSECAKVLRLQTNRCPICRQPVERFLEIDVNNNNNNISSSNSKSEEKQVEQLESPPK